MEEDFSVWLTRKLHASFGHSGDVKDCEICKEPPEVIDYQPGYIGPPDIITSEVTFVAMPSAKDFK